MGMRIASPSVTGQMYEGKQRTRTRAMRVTMLENLNVERRFERNISTTCSLRQLETYWYTEVERRRRLALTLRWE
jgi:hypothetical protein